MSDWIDTLPAALVASGLVLLPGAALLALARRPWRLVLGGAPAAGTGALGVAVVWTTLAHAPWSWWTVAVTWLLLGVLVVLARTLTRVVRRRAARPGGGASTGEVRAGSSVPGAPTTSARVTGPTLPTGSTGSTRATRLPASTRLARSLAGTVPAWLVAAALSVWQLTEAIGRPDALQQSHDGPFHLLATRAVLWEHSASWWVVGRVSTPQSAHTYYPSGLHALAALVAQACGTSVVVTLNVVVVVLCAVLWPLGLLALTREVTRGSVVATWTVALAAPFTLVFPTLLLHFGALWANLAGLAVLPSALALVLAACRHLRPGDLAAAALGAVGVGVVHPAALLSGLVLVAPLLLATAVRWLRSLDRSHPRTRRLVAPGLVLVLLVGAAACWLVLRSAPVRALVRGSTRTVTTAPEAVRQVLTLATPLTPGWLVVGVLVLVGCVASAWARCRWLVVGHLCAAVLVVCAASVSSGWGTLLTALWYREPYRLAAPLAISGLVLAGVGAAALVDLARRATPALGWLAALVVLALVAVGVPSGHASALRLVGRNYGDQLWYRTLVTEREADAYRQVLGTRRDGLRVMGDPFGGAQYAGLLSGHPNVYDHFGGAVSGDYDLLRRHFREMTPQVCAAVRALHVGYVVEDTDRVWDNDAAFPAYAGLRGLAHVPGLERIGGEGPVRIYRVTGCGPVGQA